MDLHIRQCLTKAAQRKDTDALKAAYVLIREGTPGVEKTASDTRCFCPELYVLCAEQALELGFVDISRDCLTMYFEGNPPANQFLCRAYLCQGQLESLPTICNVEKIEKAVNHFLKTMEISKDKPRYHFMVFNASVLYFQAVRPLLRPGPCQHLVPTLTQVVKALEEVGDPDYGWRAQLMLHLVTCLVDAGKGKEASSFAKATSDFIESHAPDLYPNIFSLQVLFFFISFFYTLRFGLVYLCRGLVYLRRGLVYLCLWFEVVWFTFAVLDFLLHSGPSLPIGVRGSVIIPLFFITHLACLFLRWYREVD
uniref:Cilia and flagella associated protein 46 n=1 Tax=Esox lucius TaxID=8010 RepID=A0AAY5K502_ESOLU